MVSGHVELFDEATVRVADSFDLAAFHSQNVGYDGVATAFGQQVVGQHRVFLSISPPTRRALLMHAVAPVEPAEDDDRAHRKTHAFSPVSTITGTKSAT